MEPVTRIEQFISAIIENDVTPPSSVTRIEQYLKDIYNGTTSTLTPVTRVETYLAKISGADVDIPTPVTRLEIYLAAIAGDDVDMPTPVSHLEYFLAEWANGVLKTVTGNAPLTLANAVARDIKSLTQTGLCIQDSTPTPSTPVPIKCNNGALTVVDDELPSAYKRVLGFTCNNNALWQITDFKLRGSDTLRFSVSITAGCNIIGAYTGSSSGDNYSLYSLTTTPSNYLRYKDGTYPSYLDANERYDIVITPTGTNGMKVDSTWTEEEFTTPTDMIVGATTTSGTSTKLKGNLYGDIIVDGRLHLVPCERIADNVLGYFDLVGRTFYEPYTGFDGATSLGYDGSHYVLQIVGTPEVLTVTDADSNTQTASVENLFAVSSYADEQEVIGGVVAHNVGVKALNGTEGWTISSNVFIARIDGMKKPSGNTVGLSTHYQGTANTNANMPDKSVKITYSGSNGVVAIKDTDYSTKDAFSAYLAAQYAAGTPVIIVYPLASPITEQVAAQPLTTAAGTNTVGVTAEVSPIALECEYYKQSY